VIKELRAANSAYNKKITSMYLDWVTHRVLPVRKEYQVDDMATLILLTPDGEVGRFAQRHDEDVKQYDGPMIAEIIKRLLDRATY
jgi:hypothetical protein